MTEKKPQNSQQKRKWAQELIKTEPYKAKKEEESFYHFRILEGSQRDQMTGEPLPNARKPWIHMTTDSDTKVFMKQFRAMKYHPDCLYSPKGNDDKDKINAEIKKILTPQK